METKNSLDSTFVAAAQELKIATPYRVSINIFPLVKQF